MGEPRIYRASSLGYSLCQLVAPHLGFEPIPPPEWLQAAFDEGSRLEPEIIAELEKDLADGAFIDHQQLEVNLEVIPGQAIVQGHIDGIIHYSDRPGNVIEIKTMNPKTWETVKSNGWEAGGILEKYKWQASAYMLGTGLSLCLISYNKSTGELLYTPLSEPFYTISDIALKVSQAEECIRTNTIPDGCTDYPCPYFYLHGGDNLPPEPADKDMDTLLTAWLEANRRKKVYEGEEKALREMIVEMAGTEIAGKVRGSQGVTVSTVWQKESIVNYTKKAGWVTRVEGPRSNRTM